MKEKEIRPQDLFDEYLRLAEIDVKTYFGNSKLEEIQCPACGTEGTFSFHKYSFNYKECPECATLFVSPRPTPEYLMKYYTDAPSTNFFATHFYKKTESQRREQLWKPKAALVKQKVDTYAPDTKYIMDIGGGYGIFSEEIQKIASLKPIVIEPSKKMIEACKQKNLRVIESFIEEVKPEQIPEQKAAYVSFELFEHLQSPGYFLERCYNIMRQGEILIFTTLSSAGADIRALWNNSKTVTPPQHLNFLNPKAVEILLKKIGFKLIEVTTPGKLDIDIMINNKDRLQDRFWKAFVEQSTDEQKQDMQAFLQKHKLSSHMMVVAER